MNLESVVVRSNGKNSFPNKKKRFITPFNFNSFVKPQEPVNLEIHTPSIPSGSVSSTALYNESFSRYKGFSSMLRGKIFDHRRLIERLREMSSNPLSSLREKSHIQVFNKKVRSKHLIRPSNCRVTTPYSILERNANKKKLVFNFNKKLAKIEKRNSSKSQTKTPHILNSSIKPQQTSNRHLLNLYNKLFVIDKIEEKALRLPKTIHRRYSSTKRYYEGPPKLVTRACDNIKIERIPKPLRRQSALQNPRELNICKLAMHMHKLIHRQYKGSDNALNDFKMSKGNIRINYYIH